MTKLKILGEDAAPDPVATLAYNRGWFDRQMVNAERLRDRENFREPNFAVPFVSGPYAEAYIVGWYAARNFLAERILMTKQRQEQRQENTRGAGWLPEKYRT